MSTAQRNKGVILRSNVKQEFIQLKQKEIIDDLLTKKETIIKKERCCWRHSDYRKDW